MCGIAVVVALDGAPVDVSRVERMAGVMAHRVSDDSGVLTAGSVGFGFRRSSILDLSPAGHQPMSTEDGQVVVVFNGEIYNFGAVPHAQRRSVGVDLSGGLDSTSIICSTARLRREQSATGRLMVFSYQAPEFDESTYISDTVRQTGAVLVNLKTSAQSLWDDLTRMLWYQDEPVHSMAAVIGYQLMRLAAQHA